MVFKDSAYAEYAEHIRRQGIEVQSFFSFEEAAELIEEANPGAIVSINYFSKSYEEASDILKRVRQITDCKIYLLSGNRPPAKFIQQADEMRNIEVKWGKEIDIDIENIPETEPVKTETDTEVQKEEGSLPEETDLKEPKEEPAEVTNESINNEVSDPDKSSETNLETDLEEESEKKSLLLMLESDLEKAFREKASIKYNIKTAVQVEDIPAKLENISAVILSTSGCEKYYAELKNTVKAIPKVIKLYAIDNITANQLIYGELGEIHGIKFFSDFESIIEDIEDNTVEEEEKEESTELKTRTEKSIIKNLSGTMSGILQTTKNLPKPAISFPKLNVLRDKKDPEDPHVKKQTKKSNKAHTYVEREKIMLFLSPMSTGKTEIASNVAYSLSQQGIKTALVDLDLSKKGLFYQFPIVTKEDIYTYRLFTLSLMDEQFIDEPLELAFKANKNLYVYTTHREVEIPLTSRSLDMLIRYLKKAVDVIVIDIGKDLPQELIERLLDENSDKYLVATQDIGVLNTLPYLLKWFGTFPVYYRNWNLVLNQHRPVKGLKDSEIEGYFFDQDTSDLKFQITKMFHVPENPHVWEKKTQRSIAYGVDTDFDTAIDEISHNWMFGKSCKGGVTVEV